MSESLSAVESEARDEPRAIEHEGNEYILPPPLDYPLAVVKAETDVDVVRLVLGKTQWAAYESTEPTIRNFQELAGKVNINTGN